MYRAFQLSILLYIASSVILQQRYLSTENIISGAVRISLRSPQGGVQTRPYCQPPEHPCLYWDANDILYDPNIDGALVTTRAHVRQVGPWPLTSQPNHPDSLHHCDINVPTTPGCDAEQTPVTILTPASYVADIEDFTLMLEHSIRGQATGIEIRSGNMEYGELIDSASGLTVKRWDDQSRTITPPGWFSKNDAPLMATAPGSAGSSVQQQWDPSVSPANTKPPWNSRPHKIAGDVMKVSDLLRAADVQLDAISESPMAVNNETIRSAGVVVIVVIQYGAAGWNPSKISYRYMPKAIPDQEYKVIETIRDFQAGHRVEINRHGIKIVISQHGQLGKFSMMTLLTNLVAAIALFKVANILVELMMLRLHPQKLFYGQAKYDSTRGRAGGGGGGRLIGNEHTKDCPQDKDCSFAHPEGSGDRFDVRDHYRGIASERTLQALEIRSVQQSSQQDCASTGSPLVQNQKAHAQKKEQTRPSFTIHTGASLTEHNSDHKHQSGASFCSSPSSDTQSPLTPSAATASSTTASTGASEPDTAITAAVYSTSNSSYLTQLGSRRRPASSILLNRAAATSPVMTATTTHLRERIPRYGGEEEDDIVETRYGAISLARIRTPGQKFRGFNPGQLVLSPSPPPMSPSMTATVSSVGAAGSAPTKENQLQQQTGIRAPGTPRSSATTSDRKADPSLDLTHSTPSPVRATSLLTKTSAPILMKSTPSLSSSSSSPSSAHPRSPPDMVGASPMPVCFGLSRHPSLDNLHDPSFTSPASVQSPLTSSSVYCTPTANTGADCIGGKKPPRSNRMLGSVRRSNSARNLTQRAASSPSLLTLGSATPTSTGASSSLGPSATLLHHRASHDGLSMTTSRSDSMESPSLRPTLTFNSGGSSSSITPTTLLANIGSTTVVTESPVTECASTVFPRSLILPNMSSRASADGAQYISNYGGSGHHYQQQHIRTNAFKKQKKDTGSTGNPFGTDGYPLTIASPQALSPRRVSSGSLFGTTSISSGTTGSTSPFSSAFTFRSASADPLTDRKKKGVDGTRFVGERSGFGSNDSLTDTKGKSVIFDRTLGYSPSRMASSGEWSSFYASDPTTVQFLANHGYGVASSSSLASSSSSLHSESPGSGPIIESSTPRSTFRFSQQPSHFSRGYTGVHPFDADAWSRESTSRAVSPLAGPCSTRPSPRLSVGPSPSPSAYSRPEGSRTLRSSASMPILFQGGRTSVSSSKLRSGIVDPSNSSSSLSSCSSSVGNTTRDQGSEALEQRLQDGVEESDDDEVEDEEDDEENDEDEVEEEEEEEVEDEDDEAAMSPPSRDQTVERGTASRSSPPLTPATPTSATILSARRMSAGPGGGLPDPASKRRGQTVSSTASAQEQQQLQLQSSRSPPTSVNLSAASTRSRPLPPLPQVATTAMVPTPTSSMTNSSLVAGSVATATPTNSLAMTTLPPHPLLGSSSTAASRSMPTLVAKFRSGDEGMATAAATTSATMTTMGAGLSTTSAGPFSTAGSSHMHHAGSNSGSSSSNSVRNSRITHRWSAQGVLSQQQPKQHTSQQQQQQQQQHQRLPTPESSTATSSSSSSSASSSPTNSPSVGPLDSRSTLNLSCSSSTSLPLPSTSCITPTTTTTTAATTKTAPALSHSASAHLQHFQAQILKHQQKQLLQQLLQQQQQQQQQHPDCRATIQQGLSKRGGPSAPAASLFFSSPITAASTSVLPGTGIRVLSRTITMTTEENRKLVLCRSEPLQLCEGLGEEKAARI
ncbi:cytochrome c oxidase subunit 1 [Actinomortierella ambigua]|uniref:Cytochrome c oxidase subunit 1 n=1 Tax=Actinomortierella ambigua TaxID=1343610 RepID=A0A9P6QFN7_9FUNG|nr:cytochrome c oxidase subunit 1 [Actinomortierella ambigua]